MDRLIESRYELALSKSQMKKIGFRYDYDLENYIYKFPVYKNKGIPLIFCKLVIDEDTDIVWFNVYNADNTLYTPYYDKTYGNNSVVAEIESAILYKLNKLGAVKVDSK
ncbi:MAG: hypothetical protein HDR11_01575 [Lachnospiraceae bacterium]|nr:hypothetical protein [Lachnospiraceae bacterium]